MGDGGPESCPQGFTTDMMRPHCRKMLQKVSAERKNRPITRGGCAMSEAYIVENPDPNNFVINLAGGGDRRFVFHVVAMQGGRSLQPAAWARLHERSDYTQLHEMWLFAER
jgi:hypothetical protein